MITASQRFTQFFTLIYIPYFLKASLGADSPHTDLDMYMKLYQYRRVDSDLADKALAVLGRHGRYLTLQVIPFVFFSSKVDDTKSRMAARMVALSVPDKIDIGKPFFPYVTPYTKLVNIVEEKSYLIFPLLGRSHDWLSNDPRSWEKNEDYVKMKQFLRTVKTVNNCAERDVKMVTEYAKILTHGEDTRLLLGVESNRGKYPDLKISSINK